MIRSFDIRNYAVTVLGDTSSIFEVDNAPIIADFDGDGILDLFIIAGKGRSDVTSPTDYGYAFCLSWGVGHGPAWTMFRHDQQRTGCLCDTSGLPIPLSVDYPQNNISFSVMPNPSAGEFNISFTLPQPELITVSLTDISGKEVRSAITNQYKEGMNNIQIGTAQTPELANGIYLIRLKAVDLNLTQKVVISRN